MTDNISWPELPGVTHRFLQTPRLRFHIAEAGAGEPIALLHGWLQHFYAWRDVIPELAADYRVICPDLRAADGPRRRAAGITVATSRPRPGRPVAAPFRGQPSALEIPYVARRSQQIALEP